MKDEMKPFRVFLFEDNELIDVADVDTEEEAQTYIADEGALGTLYYVVNMHKSSVYHVRRELRSGSALNNE